MVRISKNVSRRGEFFVSSILYRVKIEIPKQGSAHASKSHFPVPLGYTKT